ncbi:hypothetical protein BJ322DRAFT_851153 [Thelephora terrestris]|uniref:Uncharacterized protein n=1 Tax=Thelephora terrestris TaxID=56493 RepID=A0A9P6L680_9AGAM|nr:hypothetical protein BJ322DRAFT_851153 [Thelephora terrestris]
MVSRAMLKKRRPTASGTPGDTQGTTGGKPSIHPRRDQSTNPDHPVKKQRVVGCVKMLLDIAKESADWFPPLKAALGGVNALISHFEQFKDVKDKIQELLPQLDRLQQSFNTATLDGDPEEKNRREELVRALKQIEEESKNLLAKNAVARFADKEEDSKVVAGHIERLREAIAGYQISQQQSIYRQITHLTV